MCKQLIFLFIALLPCLSSCGIVKDFELMNQHKYRKVYPLPSRPDKQRTDSLIAAKHITSGFTKKEVTQAWGPPSRKRSGGKMVRDPRTFSQWIYDDERMTYVYFLRNKVCCIEKIAKGPIPSSVKGKTSPASRTLDGNHTGQ